MGCLSVRLDASVAGDGQSVAYKYGILGFARRSRRRPVRDLDSIRSCRIGTDGGDSGRCS